MSGPHFSLGIVEQAKRERAWKSLHLRKASFARSTFPEEKWGLLVVQKKGDKSNFLWTEMASI